MRTGPKQEHLRERRVPLCDDRRFDSWQMTEHERNLKLRIYADRAAKGEPLFGPGSRAGDREIEDI